jgi:hypothetical protein
MTDCTDGYVLPVPFKTCRLGFQGNLTSPDQAPLAFKNGTQQDAECLNQIALDVNQQIVPTVGAGMPAHRDIPSHYDSIKALLSALTPAGNALNVYLFVSKLVCLEPRPFCSMSLGEQIMFRVLNPMGEHIMFRVLNTMGV